MMSITPTDRSSKQSLSHEHFSMLNPHPAVLKTTESEYRDELKTGLKTSWESAMQEPESDPLHEAARANFLMKGMPRTHTLQSLSISSTSSVESTAGLLQDITSRLHEQYSSFGMDLRRETESHSEVPTFNKLVRRAMESHLRKARLIREKARKRTKLEVHASIASSVGVPYVRLRQERPFLFDVHTHPLHEVLSESLGVNDLSKIHEEGDLRPMMQPLLSRSGRRPFQDSYDTFVTSFCVPLLHSLAMSQNLFHGTATHSHISYRYQTFPRIRIVKPGDTSDGPQCGTASGHSIGYLHFHVPLTASTGTNALYTESHPGKEDWHPLIAKSVGLGFLFDGARCLHFNMENTTSETSVSLEFVVAIFDEKTTSEYVDGESLCNISILEDDYSLAGPGYYDEVVIGAGMGSPSWQIATKKHGDHRWDPDHRVGFPFS